MSDELTHEQFKESLETGARMVETLIKVYRERDIEACSTELYEYVDLDQAKWALLAAVLAIAHSQEQIEGMGFDQRHFGNGGPRKLH
jgi:hypothetical protein